MITHVGSRGFEVPAVDCRYIFHNHLLYVYYRFFFFFDIDLSHHISKIYIAWSEAAIVVTDSNDEGGSDSTCQILAFQAWASTFSCDFISFASQS